MCRESNGACTAVGFQVQLLSDNQRGATLEAVVSRMKTIHSLNATELKQTSADCPGIRFIAVSATIPNVSDVRRLPSKFFLQILSATYGNLFGEASPVVEARFSRNRESRGI